MLDRACVGIDPCRHVRLNAVVLATTTPTRSTQSASPPDASRQTTLHTDQTALFSFLFLRPTVHWDNRRFYSTTPVPVPYSCFSSLIESFLLPCLGAASVSRNVASRHPHIFPPQSNAICYPLPATTRLPPTHIALPSSQFIEHGRITAGSCFPSFLFLPQRIWLT